LKACLSEAVYFQKQSTSGLAGKSHSELTV
jgi:hypothetical protein